MDEVIDFEELIDVKPFLASVLDTAESQKSSQETLGDVLDNMCKAMTENNVEIDNVLDTVKQAIDDTISDDPILDLDDFESFLAATSISKDCVKDAEKIDDVVIDLTIEEEDSINAIVPYQVPIYFGDIGPALTETVTNEFDKDKIPNLLDDANELETDNKIISLLDLAVNYTTKVNEIVDFNYVETIETKVETPHKLNDYEEPQIIDFDELRDIVSPSFTECDYNDGYNSSDFEFIDENEATKAGIVTKFHSEKSICKTVHDNQNCCANSAVNVTHSNNDYNRPTTSRNNEASYSEYMKYSKYRYHSCYAQVSLEHHVLPEGEQYLDLFRGQYSPMIINNLHILKNKSALPAMAMAARSDDMNLGFQIPEREDNEEHVKDAEECAKLILSTYPGDNRKKRRHY